MKLLKRIISRTYILASFLTLYKRWIFLFVFFKLKLFFI